MAINRYSYLGKGLLTLKSTLKGNTNFGFCPSCNRKTFFVKDNGDYDRDFLECVRCGSLPRQRMIMRAIEEYAPNWKSLKIHESSPDGSASHYIEKGCSDYSCSHYFPEIELGTMHRGFRCENLEKLTFDDNTFDLFISQEVMEHVFDVENAYKEIARVLKPGGLHIFTTPIVTSNLTTQRAKIKQDGTVEHIKEPAFHGNPINPEGSLVTFDWGIEMPHLIQKWADTPTSTYIIQDKNQGLSGEMCEAFISYKFNT